MRLRTILCLCVIPILVALPICLPGYQKTLLDPAAWGGNHVGKPIPDYVHGDECLFCHRNDIGPGWQRNAHGRTVREKEAAPELRAILAEKPELAQIAPEVEYLMGSRSHLRFLKKAGYGKFALLSTRALLDSTGQPARWEGLQNPVWQDEKFADRCAGCHATAVNPASRSFAAFGLDCYTCHGDVSLDHSNDTSLVWLSKKRRRETREITSICAQCHLRNGRARSTGLPYPNNFLAGDNLFQDFQVDFSDAENPELNPGDRHVLRNVRDVVLHGEEEVGCLTCHSVHEGTSRKHRLALRAPSCLDCHNAEGPLKEVRKYEVHSPLCEY